MLMDVSCMKCSRPAVVHLTDITAIPGGGREIVQVHLCMKHAVSAGIVGSLPVAPDVGHKSGQATDAIASSAEEGSSGEDEHEEQFELDDAIDELAFLADDADADTPSLKIAADSPAKAAASGGTSAPASQIKCPYCGTTWDDFRRSGVMGCANDYVLFEAQLNEVLDGLHEGHVTHYGKIAEQAQISQAVVHARTQRLQTRLAEALAQEKYEEAARLRDELKQQS